MAIFSDLLLPASHHYFSSKWPHLQKLKSFQLPCRGFTLPQAFSACPRANLALEKRYGKRTEKAKESSTASLQSDKMPLSSPCLSCAGFSSFPMARQRTVQLQLSRTLDDMQMHLLRLLLGEDKG